MKRREFVKQSLGIVGASTLFGSEKISANDLRPEQLTFKQVKALPIGSYILCEICPQRRFNPNRCTGMAKCVGRFRIDMDDDRYCVPIRLRQTQDKMFRCSIGLVTNYRYAYGKGHTKDEAIQDAIVIANRIIHIRTLLINVSNK